LKRGAVIGSAFCTHGICRGTLDYYSPILRVNHRSPTTFIRRLMQLALFFFGFASTAVAQVEVVLVDPTSPNPAVPYDFWGNAARDLQTAIDYAENVQNVGARVLVAEGNYFPPLQGGDPRDRYFLIGGNSGTANTDLEIIGGYVGYNGGNPGSSDPLNPDGNPVRTVLNGNPGPGQTGQAYRILLIENANTIATRLVVARLSIWGGLADVGTAIQYGNDGAGAYVRRNQGLVEFRTVQFGANYARFDPAFQAPANEQARGGAAFISPGVVTEVRFRDCAFVGNSARLGGAVYLNVVEQARIGNCYFRNNGTYIDNYQLPGIGYTMPICEQGGGLFIFSQATALVSNTVFNDNAARFEGGAIYWQPFFNWNPGTTVQSLRHCTITLNAVQATINPVPPFGQQSRGAGVYIAPGDIEDPAQTPARVVKRVDMTNSILWGNRFADDLSVHGIAAQGISGTHAYLRYNYLGTVAAYDVTVIPLWTGIEQPVGNIAGGGQSPFINLGARNFRLPLLPPTPCRDAGQNEGVIIGPPLPSAANYSFVGRDIVDLNEDGSVVDNLIFDLDQPAPRIVGVSPNMGAFEG
jgi:hypothetical protein